MMNPYQPPYTVSERAITLIAEIAAALERYRIVMEGPDGVGLRKVNRVKTIRGTTAVEGNTLTEEQVTAVLEGRRVVAPKREIEEIKGAHAAYELLERIASCSEQDLLGVHVAMMGGLGLVEGVGALRTKGVGVVDDQCLRLRRIVIPSSISFWSLCVSNPVSTVRRM